MADEINIQDKYWLNNKQVVGAFGVFILLGIGYGEFRGMQANDEMQDLEIKLLRERALEEEGEMKSLVHTKAREGGEQSTRRIAPLRKDIEDLKAWMNYEKGFQAASVKRP